MHRTTITFFPVMIGQEVIVGAVGGLAEVEIGILLEGEFVNTKRIEFRREVEVEHIESVRSQSICVEI